jgi:hypothetical protein
VTVRKEILLKKPQENISGKSGDFTFSNSGKEVQNISANPRIRWISNHSEKIQNFFRNPRGPFVVSLKNVHAVVL